MGRYALAVLVYGVKTPVSVCRRGLCLSVIGDVVRVGSKLPWSSISAMSYKVLSRIIPLLDLYIF
jgi:hypothetical protein